MPRIKSLIILCLLTLLGVVASAESVWAAKGKKKKAEVEQATEEKSDEDKKSIADVTKDSDRFDGLFVLFQNRDNGKLHMLVRSDQIDREYVYFRMIRDGVAEAGETRGSFGAETVFSVRKHFNRIEFVRENTAFYFDPESALSRAADANISHAVVAIQEIVAEDDSAGEFLIEADDLFLTESFSPIKAIPNPHHKGEPKFSLGSLSKEKSKILELHNYPENTVVVAEYVFEKPEAVPAKGEEVTDARFVSISVQHSLIQIPDNDFQPRYGDPRIGYFVTRSTDLSSQDVAPYRDIINRWHLKKKDPSAELSEPVEPIIFWIENTTPVWLRPTIKRAGETWNLAFEKAGFKNAVVIEQQPDDADWDAGDLRYNVLRWTSSPNPVFGGYGPSYFNPRTGQILGADIMLEFVYLTNRLRYTEIFGTAALPSQDLGSPERMRCSFGHEIHKGMLFGKTVQAAMNATLEQSNQLVEDGIYSLILHEIGHTLGLSHNMKASQMNSLEEINDRELTERIGMTGSVMDYEPLNIVGPGQHQGQYYNRTPGPYDLWAIEYGYSEAVAEPEAERERLQAILSRSTEPELMFGNDADDMRSPKGGVDPRVMIDDQSSDAIGYAVSRMELIDELMPELVSRLAFESESYQRLLNGYLILSAQYASAANVISRYIGGVYVDRAFVGQPGATTPYVPVPADEQKRAMQALEQHVFSPVAFDSSASLYGHLQVQRRDFNLFGQTEDPKVHERILEIQQGVLRFLLDPVTMARISDTTLYGNEYRLTDFMTDLTDAIFEADAGEDISTFRQNLQVEYVKRLIGMVGIEEGSEYDYLSQSVALANLRRIERLTRARSRGGAQTRAHTAYLAYLIEKALEA
jgi:hypothetical protein